MEPTFEPDQNAVVEFRAFRHPVFDEDGFFKSTVLDHGPDPRVGRIIADAFCVACNVAASDGARILNQIAHIVVPRDVLVIKADNLMFGGSRIFVATAENAPKTDQNQQKTQFFKHKTAFF